AGVSGVGRPAAGGAVDGAGSAAGDAGQPVTLHLLGYLFDPADPAFVAERQRLRASRLERGRRIVELLQADGYSVDWPGVLALAGGRTVGRPHIGRALVRAGAAGSVQEAFARLLDDDSPYYVPKGDTEGLAAIRMVRAAGGGPGVAHPLARRRRRGGCGGGVAGAAAARRAGRAAGRPGGGPPGPRAGRPGPPARAGCGAGPVRDRLE